ncbi:MAG: hypothetical protein KY453_08575 [Gemmatimonadetes bacterium]|nr:hypothetical protein [Gemmatimonadota bacterium]
MTRENKRRSDGHNRGIRDPRGDLWEVELGRRSDVVDPDAAVHGFQGKVIFCRKPDGLAFSVSIPPGQTLADYDDDALVAMIDQHLRGGEGRRAV